MYITLYFIVTRLLDSLHAVRDHFLALHPTDLTVDLLEKHLLAAETSVVAVGAARGTPRTPGCSPSPLAPSYTSAAVVDVFDAEDVKASSASGKRHSSKGNFGRGGGSGSGSGGGGSNRGGGGSGDGGTSGSGGGSGGFGGGGGGSGGRSGSGGSGSGGSPGGAVPRGGSGGGQRQLQQRQSKTPSPQQLRGWCSRRGESGGSVSCPYVIHTGDRAGQTCGKPHTQHPCYSRLDDTWRAQFGDEAELPRWAELLRSRVAIFDLHYDAILAATYALSVSAEGDCYLYVVADPDIEAAALGASESALPGNAPAGALHTFMLDSSASRSFFRDSTTLTPLSAPVSASPPALACLPCIEGRQRAAPHSSSFPSTTAPLHTLHMDVWGPARVSGQGRERYFLLFVHDNTRYTGVFPLRSKVEFSSDLLRDFCRGEGILQSFTLPASPQQNGTAERHIGLVMEVAHTSMIYAAAPNFLWPFAVWYAAHQLNLWPRVSLLETLPTLHWTGKVGDASVFWDVTFDESVPFYCLFPYRSAPLPPPPLSLARGPPPVDPLPPQAASGGAESGGAEPAGAEPKGAESEGARSWGAELAGAVRGGAEPAGVVPRGAELEGAEPGGAESEGAESRGAEPRGTASSGGHAGAWPRLTSRPERLCPQQLSQLFARRTRLRSGAAGAGDSAAGGTGAWFTGASSTGVAQAGGAAGVGAGGIGAGAARGTGVAGPEGARTGGTGAAGAGCSAGVGAGDPGVGAAGGTGATGPGGAGGTVAARAGGAAGVGAGDPGAGDIGAEGAGPWGASAVGAGSGDTGRPQPYFVPLIQQPAYPLPAPSPYTEKTGGLTEHREPMSCPASPVRAVRTGRRVPRPRPPPVPGTHHMALHPSSVPQHVPLPSPPASSLADGPDLESDLVRGASPTVTRLLATVVTDPSFECAVASALVVIGSSCEAEIYAGAMAAQDLRWLTYLLTDLGEWPRSSPVLYVDNKAMIVCVRSTN
ncbi:unnamed protein product [Closterium sp. NIES-54]